MAVTIAKTTRTQRLVVSNTDNNINNPVTNNLAKGVITNLPDTANLVMVNPATARPDTERLVTDSPDTANLVTDTRPVTCRLVTDTRLTLTADKFFEGKGNPFSLF